MINSLKCHLFFCTHIINDNSDIEQLCHEPDGLLVNVFAHRFLATDVSACPTMHEDIKIISRAACVLTNQTRLVRLRCKSKYNEFRYKEYPVVTSRFLSTYNLFAKLKRRFGLGRTSSCQLSTFFIRKMFCI